MTIDVMCTDLRLQISAVVYFAADTRDRRLSKAASLTYRADTAQSRNIVRERSSFL